MTHPRRPRQVVTPRRPPLLPKVVTTVGLVVLSTTFLSAVPALIGPISFLLTWFIPVPVLDWFTAVALLILGSVLQRRMRVGWVATTFLTCVSLVLFIVAIVFLILAHQPGLTPLDLVAQGVNALQLTILIVALVRTRRTYHVHMRPGNVWRALAITTIGTGTSSGTRFFRRPFRQSRGNVRQIRRRGLKTGRVPLFPSIPIRCPPDGG